MHNSIARHVIGLTSYAGKLFTLKNTEELSIDLLESVIRRANVETVSVNLLNFE